MRHRLLKVKKKNEMHGLSTQTCCSPWMQIAHFMMIFTYWRDVCCFWVSTETLLKYYRAFVPSRPWGWCDLVSRSGPSKRPLLVHRSPWSLNTHTRLHTYIRAHSCILMVAVFSLTMFAELEIALIIYKVNFLSILGPAQFKHERVWQEIPRAVRWMSCMEREMSVCEFSWRLHRLCCIDCTAALGNEIPM